MVHWDDVKANMKELASDLANQKIGIVGIALIIFMVTIGALAPVFAPNADVEWDATSQRWAENPERAPPVWYDWFTTEDYAHHETENDYLEPQRSTSNRRIVRFSKEIDSDVPPQDFYMRVAGEADQLDRIVVTVERPETDTEYDLDKWTVYNQRIRESGDFEEGITLRRRSQFREIAHSKGQQYLVNDHDIERANIPSSGEITNPVHVLTAKPNEDILTDPDVLKGEYTITITLYGDNIQMDEEGTSITFSGAVFGVMGTDRTRRDLWQGWVWGARYGLLAGGIVAIMTIILSTLYGMTSAYYGGWVDEAMQRLNEIMMGIPTLPVLIILLMWQRSIWMFILVYALLMWRGAAKVVRSRGLQVAKDTYIEAAEALGSGSARIIRKHMIPQILPYSFAQAALLIPIVIMAEAGLHILGLGDPGIVTWGTILNDAYSKGALLNISRSWWWVILPGVGMVVVGFGFIATGMAIERIINPKMKQR